MARGAGVSAPYSASSSKLPKGRKQAGSGGGGGNRGTGKQQGARLPSQPRDRDLEVDDAYTYLPSAPKRSRTSAFNQSLSKDEAASASGPRRRKQPGAGGDQDDEDEDEAMEERIRRVAMKIADDNLVELSDDEESDVDSDEAWEEDGSDEERWGDVFRDLNKSNQGGNGKGKKTVEVVKKVSLNRTTYKSLLSWAWKVLVRGWK